MVDFCVIKATEQVLYLGHIDLDRSRSKGLHAGICNVVRRANCLHLFLTQ